MGCSPTFTTKTKTRRAGVKAVSSCLREFPSRDTERVVFLVSESRMPLRVLSGLLIAALSLLNQPTMAQAVHSTCHPNPGASRECALKFPEPYRFAMDHISRRYCRRTFAVVHGLVACLLTVGCSPKSSDHPPAFTLKTGVAIKEQTPCKESIEPSASINNQSKGSYEIVINEFLACDARVDPYLTETLDNKATLVLTPLDSEGGVFNSACECGRSLVLAVTDRLEPGNVVYILGDYRVVGHLVVP
jgi:hypothetical protein